MEEIQKALEAYIDEEKRRVLPRFFKTGKGEYGEGDKFLGITVPNIRLVAKRYKDAAMEIVERLLQSEWHECRMCALLILVERFKKAKEGERKRIFDFYLNHTQHINNWDLVDLSAPQIVGGYLTGKPHDVLHTLAQSPILWEQRIAIVSTLTFIRNNEFADTVLLAEHFMTQPGKMHDLMQKATGWMLREMGKRDKGILVRFLKRHAATMPRTMLRYAIEKFSEEERRRFMGTKFTEHAEHTDFTDCS